MPYIQCFYLQEYYLELKNLVHCLLITILRKITFISSFIQAAPTIYIDLLIYQKATVRNQIWKAVVVDKKH